MNTGERVSRDGEHSQGIRVAEIVLPGERQLTEVVDTREVLRLDIDEAAAVEGDVLLDPLDEPAQPIELEHGEPLSRHGLGLRLEDHSRSIPAGNAIVTP